MNLIEKLGGYEAVKAKFKEPHLFGEKHYLKHAMLEYRREHRIFEVGDFIVKAARLKDGDLYRIGEIAESKNYIKTGCGIFIDTPMFRHATDAEIKAGHRIIHPTDNLSHLTDHCTDIRNHISPNTIVLDSDVINFDLYIPMRSK